MRKVKYIRADHIVYINLTISKVYDVIGYENGFVSLIDNDGLIDYFPLNKFEDVTSEFRNEIIDEILM